MMVKDLCFEIIQTCPNNCIFCSSISSIDCTEKIDFELFKKAIDHFMILGGIEEISISGGEPFLHPNLFEMIAYCKERGIRVVLFTSGIKNNKTSRKEIKDYLNGLNIYCESCGMSEEERRKVIQNNQRILDYYASQFEPISKEEMERLKAIGLDKIVFDFQGSSEESFKYLMGENHFTIVSRSMIRAVLAGLDTDVHFIPMKGNYMELPDIIELLNIAGVNQLSVLNFVPQGRGKVNQEKIMLSKEEMNEFISIFNSCKDTFKGKIRVGIPLMAEDRHKCTAGLDKLVIKYDGTVLPCPAFKEFDNTILNRMGIKIPNIHTDLDSVAVHNGNRVEPLCKKLYNFESSLVDK